MIFLSNILIYIPVYRTWDVFLTVIQPYSNPVSHPPYLTTAYVNLLNHLKEVFWASTMVC